MDSLQKKMRDSILKAIEVEESIEKLNNYVFIGNEQSCLYTKDIIYPEKISCYLIWNQKNKQFRTITGELVDISFVKDKIRNNYCVICHMFSRYITSILSDVYKQKDDYGNSNFIDVTHKNWRSVNMLSAQILKQNIENIEYVYQHLEDDDSRKVLYNSINFRITRNPSVLKTSRYKQYFHPNMFPFTDSIIIEGGAFNGNSSLDFLKKAEKKSTIYAYEPDFNNYMQSLKNIHTSNAIGNILLINNGLSDRKKVLKFSSNAQSSFVNNDGEDYIFCSSIDELTSGVNLKPTHIKLDIEGEEANALFGAIRTIKTYKPKLLISAYHKPEDIWRLLQIIQSFRNDYKFFLGFHSDAFTIYEIVLYAY